MTLNSHQLEAAMHYTGPCMVLAGPGSGKTTVLLSRVETLLLTYRVPPEQILVITFTKAAADEMKSRFQQKKNVDGSKVTFGTFHAFFYEILRSDSQSDSFRVLSESERRSLFFESVREAYPRLTPDRDTADGLLLKLSAMLNQNGEIEDDPQADSELSLKKIAAVFQRKKKANQRIDFDDMQWLAYERLRANKALREHWKKRFSFFLIDEFQDINPLQYKIVRLLLNASQNLFIVGDDDQSIYRFRGSSPSIMRQFPADFPTVKTFYLTMNYRSYKEIVAASSRLIGENKKRFPKSLTDYKGAGGTVRHVLFPSPIEESDAICRMIQERTAGQRSYRDIAILTRTHSGATLLLEKLAAAKIPYFAAGKIHNLFLQPVCGPVFAALNFLYGNASRENFLRFMNAPYRGFLRTEIPATVSLTDLQSYYQRLPDRSYMVKKIERMKMETELMKKIKDPSSMVNYYRKGVGYDRYVVDEARRLKREEKENLEILDELQESAKPYSSVRLWFASIAAYSQNLAEKEKTAKRKPGNEVFLTTYHQAKGLEFPIVFLPDVNERIVPHEKALLTDDVEEERRLFYVGMTRASEELYLSSVRERFGRALSVSRFLKETGIKTIKPD